MDVSKLNDKELLELQKNLRLEIKKREVSGTYKSEFLVTKRLIELFGDDVYSKGITNGYISNAPAYFWTDKFERAIYSLCDLTFGNYIARKTKDNHHIGIHMGLSILPPEIDEKKYGNMIDDIFEIMKKFKEEKNNE